MKIIFFSIIILLTIELQCKNALAYGKFPQVATTIACTFSNVHKSPGNK